MADSVLELEVSGVAFMICVIVRRDDVVMDDVGVDEMMLFGAAANIMADMDAMFADLCWCCARLAVARITCCNAVREVLNNLDICSKCDGG